MEITRRSARPAALPIAVGGAVEYGGTEVMISDQALPGALPMHLPEGAVLTVTPWRPSDWLRVPGSRGRRSFKRLCADRGLTPEERDQLPVLRVGEAHAADPVFGVSADFAPCSGEQTVFVRFTNKQTEEKRHEK